MKDPEHPDWMWTAAVSELDGRYLELYVSKDSSRVRVLIKSPCGLNRDRLD